MLLAKLKMFLDSHDTKYVTIGHSKTFTAQEVAASAHIPGKEMAKTVIVKLDGKLAMTVLPASEKVDFDLLKDATGATKLELATENEFRDSFPGCEAGAMPPFGNLYGMEVYVAEDLAEDEWIAFNAGTHTDLIQMAYEDYSNLVQPQILQFGVLS